MLAAVVVGVAPAAAEPAWLGWAFGGNPTATWSAESLADYMYTGHAPHPAVARIVAPEAGGASLGSGVLVDTNGAQGLVLSNWHVVRDSRSAVLVQFPDGFQSAGTVVRWDEAWDLAAVVIWKPTATPIPVATEPPRIGERLTIAGFGRGIYREETGECTEYLSPGSGYAKEFVELKATARQGDSGGPIFNERRELAGVLFGQNDGRTIGSCSTRVREFLASVGSRGVVAAAVVAASGPAARAGGDRVAGAQVSDAVLRSTHVGRPVAGPLLARTGPAGPVRAWPSDGTGGPAPPLAGPGVPAWMPDPWLHRSELLAAAGGAALVVLGLRTLFGGRPA